MTDTAIVEGIKHIEVFARKLAVRLVSKLSEECLFPDDKFTAYEEFLKRRELVDELTEEIQTIIERHHEDVGEYLSRYVSFNPYYTPISQEEGSEGEHVLPERVSEHLMEVVHQWRLLI